MSRQPEKLPTHSAVVDLDAIVVKRVLAFAANKNEPRYYLRGIHVVPGKVVRLEATDGHRAYIEEDTTGIAGKEVILAVSAGAQRWLRRGYRVRLDAQGVLSVVDASGVRVYIEPQNTEWAAQYPSIVGIIGDISQWVQGLPGAYNANYLREALQAGGGVRFYHRASEPDGGTLLVSYGHGTGNGGKAFALVMPVRMDPKPLNQLLPSSLVKAANILAAERAAKAGAA